MKDMPMPDPWPMKAYKNLDFLNSPAARSIRIECELAEPRQRFQRQEILHTIVFFGSARSRPRDTLPAGADPAGMQARLSAYYEQARELARRLSTWSLEIPAPRDRFYICSGGGPGMMEAANRGATEAGLPSVGLGISLPMEQGINSFCTPELSFEFHYFFIRKYWFFYLAKAMVVFPGGFGTMDELFEMLTLIQTRKSHKQIPIVLFGADFWHSVLNFQALVDWGVISPDDLGLFRIMDNVEETYAYLTRILPQIHHSNGKPVNGNGRTAERG